MNLTTALEKRIEDIKAQEERKMLVRAYGILDSILGGDVLDDLDILKESLKASKTEANTVYFSHSGIKFRGYEQSYHSWRFYVVNEYDAKNTEFTTARELLGIIRG